MYSNIQYSGTACSWKCTNADRLQKYSTTSHEQLHCLIFPFVFQTKDYDAIEIALSVPEELLCVV